LFSGDGERLARKSRRYHVNKSSPCCAVEGSHVGPDGKGREKSVGLPLRKNGCAVGINLNGADGSPPEQVAAEYAATSACEKSQLIQRTPPE
jgi:hypothetical protein